MSITFKIISPPIFSLKSKMHDEINEQWKLMECGDNQTKISKKT